MADVNVAKAPEVDPPISNIPILQPQQKTSMTTKLEKKLAAIEGLARGSVLGRFLSNPVRYASAIGFWRLVYPIKKHGKFARATTFFGPEMQVVLPSATEIYLFGAKTHDSEIRLARFLMKNLKPGDTFCDVGAHFGYFTLLASQLVGEKGRVLAIEASKSTYGILTKNTAPFGNISTHHIAASDEDKVLVFNEFPALYSEYNSLVLPKESHAGWLRRNPPRRTEVQGVRLGDFLAKQNLKPSIIKIDVEGAEPQVLRGLEGLLRQSSPNVVMEYLLAEGQNEAHRGAARLLESLGYQPFILRADGIPIPCVHIEQAMLLSGIDSENVVFGPKKSGGWNDPAPAIE
jgi:FkbM family methyltransferase